MRLNFSPQRNEVKKYGIIKSRYITVLNHNILCVAKDFTVATLLEEYCLLLISNLPFPLLLLY